MRSAGIDVRGLAHITGGGLVENPPRILKDDVACELRLSSWTVPPIFQLLQRIGKVPLAEMRQVFNMGLGMLVSYSFINIFGVLLTSICVVYTGIRPGLSGSAGRQPHRHGAGRDCGLGCASSSRLHCSAICWQP